MIEILWNQLASTLPIHFFAYAPFFEHLRWGKKKTFALVAAAEFLYLFLFAFLLQKGLSPEQIQLFAMPLFGILFFLTVDMAPGKIMFLYVFSIAYIQAVRGTVAFLESFFSGDVQLLFYSWHSALLGLLLYAATMPAMLRYLKQTAQMVIETHAPQVWKTAWILPLFNTAIVLLFTYAPQSTDQVNVRFFLTRILLIGCMFLVYHFVLRSIHRLSQQAAAEERSRYMEQLADIQSAQYALLKSRIEETRKAQHDLRQHLRVIRGCIERGDLDALSSYVQIYQKELPSGGFREYCGNYAADSILNFYAEKAAAADIPMEIAFCRLATSVIPEPEFCVLLGNLLENALDSCLLQRSDASPSESFIKLAAEMNGNHTLLLTLDNSCPNPPVFQKGRFLSSKHEGLGIGTQSVRSIAEKYQGDARFTWKDGVFFASVMLNGTGGE